MQQGNKKTNESNLPTPKQISDMHYHLTKLQEDMNALKHKTDNSLNEIYMTLSGLAERQKLILHFLQQKHKGNSSVLYSPMIKQVIKIYNN